MRFTRRFALAVATCLQVAPPPLASAFAHTQDFARASQAHQPHGGAMAGVAGRDSARRTISVELEDTPLARALGEIARLGQLRLTYSRDVLPADHRVSLRASSISAGQALQQALRGTGLGVHVSASGDATIFRAAPTPPAAASQLQGIVAGRVSDAASGRPLAGAQISVQGTRIGALTGPDGSFRLAAVPDGTQRVQASMVGYAAQQRSVTVATGETATVDFALQPQAVALEGLVVIGYGTQERRDLTGSIASVKGEELAAVPAPSVSMTLQGKAPGVSVISSGRPGDDASIRIRGIGSMNADNRPLIVLDGIPIRDGLNQLNPKDIESIDVLKDASSTAIYGARGANGVLMITTKKGSASKGGLEFSASQGYQQVTEMVEMLDAAAFAQMHNEMMENAGRAQNPDFADPAQLGRGTDWLGEMVDVAPMRNYSASFSGGSEKSSFYVSGNLLQQDGVIRNTSFDRYTLQLNGKTSVRDWLSVGNNLTLNHDVKRSGNGNVGAAMAAQPVMRIFNDDGTYAGPVGRSEWVGDVINPIGQAELIDNSTHGYNLIGSVFGDVSFSDDLSLRSTVGVQANFWNNRTWSPKYNWQPNPQEDSYLSESSNRNTNWLFDNILTYDRLFGDVHDLKVMVGTSAQGGQGAWISGSVQGFANDRTQELVNGIKPPTLGGSESEWAMLSFMGRVNYDYDDTYLLTATVRRDGTSRFGQARRWGVFPSMSAAWRISNEDFFEGIDFVDDLKLRVGFGVTGNQEIGNLYASAAQLRTVQYNFGSNIVSAVVPHKMPNPDVHWESARQFNAGLDAAAFDNRVRLSLDGYIKNTTGMLVPMAVPVTTGFSDIDEPDINAGKIRNRGVELTLSTDNLRGRVNWTTDFNISRNDNEVVSLNDTIPMVRGGIDFNFSVARAQAGHPMDAFYGYVTNGIFQTQEEVDAYAVQVAGGTAPGDVRFVDLNNDGVINDQDRTFLGDPNPDFTFGLTNSVSFGNLDLRLFVQGVYGNEIFNANRIWTEGMSSARNQSAAVRDRWTGAGTSNTTPRAVYGDPNKNARPSDRFLEDGSYLRVKDFTIGYTLPEGLSRRLNASRARVYATGQNLWTLTDYTGFDPEVGFNGIDNNLYPVTRTVSFGIDLSL